METTYAESREMITVIGNTEYRRAQRGRVEVRDSRGANEGDGVTFHICGSEKNQQPSAVGFWRVCVPSTD